MTEEQNGHAPMEPDIDAFDVDTAPAEAGSPPPGELTEAQLEALLFVSERPLTRREIGTLAGVDRATVDDRARRPRGLPRGARDPVAALRRSGRARHRAGGRRPDRSLHRRRRDPPLAGLARDARDRRLPPARREVGDRADPRRRLGLHDPIAPPPPARRRARSVGCAGPPVPVRHRLRVPRAVRPHEPRRAAPARRRGGRPARRGGRGSLAGRRGMPTPADTVGT